MERCARPGSGPCFCNSFSEKIVASGNLSEAALASHTGLKSKKEIGQAPAGWGTNMGLRKLQERCLLYIARETVGHPLYMEAQSGCVKLLKLRQAI